MNRTSPSRALAAARHLLGASAAVLVLAAPLVHAEEATRASEVRTHAEAGGSGPKQSGLIPGVLIGPRLTVAVPTPTFGVEVKILRFVGASFDYGFFPKLTISGVDVSYSMWNVAARAYRREQRRVRRVERRVPGRRQSYRRAARTALHGGRALRARCEHRQGTVEQRTHNHVVRAVRDLGGWVERQPDLRHDV